MKVMKYFVAALAVAAPAGHASAERLFGLTADNRIVTFDSASAGTVTSSGAISGIATGDVLTGIDLRPANRTLYSIATNGNIYAITKNPSGSGYTATFTRDGVTGSLSGNRFGVDFNPVPDRLRVVTDFDQNLRINVDAGGMTAVDTAINGPGSIDLVGAAYTNSRAGATSTMLYGLDASGNQLLRSTNPNAGTYVEVGAIGGNIDLGGRNNVGFDISGGSGVAFFSNGARLYTINLSNAQTTSLGTIGAGSLVGLTAGAVPEPASWALMIGGFGMVGGLARRRSPRKSAELFA